ncbi:phage tail protein I [Salinisphaera sp. USBA-960]|nr:phage tail protein I [Salifodinibacter halophilus]
MSGDQSLLPPNSTSLERDLEAVTERATSIDASFGTLWDPWTCPAEILPWLAWALGVTEWSADWPVKRRREAVASILEIRHHAGTVAAVRRAVEAQSIEGISYREWHEYGGEPGTYRLTATLENRGMSQAEYNQLIRVIERAKRLSAHMDPVGFTLQGRGTPSPASATLAGQQTEIRPYLETRRDQHGPALTAATVQSADTTTVQPAVNTRAVQIHAARIARAAHAVVAMTVRPLLQRRAAQSHPAPIARGLQSICRTTVRPA